MSEVDEVIDRLIDRNLLDVATTIARESHVPLEAMLGRSRHKSVAAARRKLYAALRGLGLSTVEVGEVLARDHSTVVKVADPRARMPVTKPSHDHNDKTNDDEDEEPENTQKPGACARATRDGDQIHPALGKRNRHPPHFGPCSEADFA